MLKYVLRDRFGLSATMLRRLKNGGAILLNGSPVYVTARVAEGDALLLCFPPEAADFPAQEGPLSILWEDGHFLALEKPVGLLTHPSHSRYTDTLANYALAYVQKNGGESCHAVGRLDRDTGGVLLFAKSGYAKSLARELPFEKRYLALVFGLPPEEAGVVDLPIRRAAEHEQRRIVAADGSPSRTRYRLLRRFSAEGGGAYSLLLLRLETGRTHQIRVHMAALGCPLLGDRLYGDAASLALSAQLGVNAQALHACRLRFTHPLSGEEIDLRSLPTWPQLAALPPEEAINTPI